MNDSGNQWKTVISLGPRYQMTDLLETFQIENIRI